MNNTIKASLSAIFICLRVGIMWAQADGNSSQVNYNVGMFPKTPDAAALSKFVDIPAGSYTGVADFSIPLYTIEFDGGNIPIELRYTTTGIKVGEIASRIGLGWSLNTGPSLSQQVIGSQDIQLRKPVINDNFEPVLPGDPNDFNNPYYVAVKATGLILGEEVVDIKHDIYSYSLLSESGKFIIDSGGEFGIPMPYNQTKIIPAGSNVEIIDEQGNNYIFDKHSAGSIRSFNSCVNNVMSAYDDPNYKILQIKSTKNDHVNYTYGKSISTKYATSVTHQKREEIINEAPGINAPPLPPQCVNYTIANERILTEISFEGGKVFFYYNNDPEGTASDREDLVGDVYLTRVIVKNNKQQVIKDFSLQYDYFRSTDTPPGYPSAYSQYMQGINRRLKLTKIIDNLTSGDYNLSYYESYNSKTLPIRISNNQDYWGVFNGKSNGSGIPTIKYNSLITPGYNYIIQGADKEPDINYGILGNLKKIEYPTGGYTEVTYEADDYIKQDHIPPLYEYHSEFQYTASDEYPEGVIFELTDSDYNEKLVFNGESDSPIMQHGICRFYLYKKDANGVFNQILSNTQSNSYELRVNSGTYKLVVTTSEQNPSFYCDAELEWLRETVADDSETRKAGTLRVKRIESNDTNNGKLIREYTYKDPDTKKSSGKNLGNEIFMGLSTQMSPSGNLGHTSTERILSNNPGWQTATVRGKPIGYDYVQEHYISENDPSKSYRKEYKFKNDIDDQWAQHNPYSPINYTWPIEGLDRGLLLEEKLFDSSNKLVQKTSKEYELNTHFNSLATSYQSGTTVIAEGLEIIPIKNNPGNIYEFAYSTFPIKNFWLTDILTTTTEYKTPTDSLTTEQRTRYSIPQYKHTYPVETLSNGSHGEAIKTVYKYPQDLTGLEPYMQELKAANRLSTPVIIESSYIEGLNYTPISTQKTDYAMYQGNLLLPKFIYLKKGTQSFEKKITYDRYDHKGNLEQYTMENGTTVSIIWGYNNKYPIAKVENIQYSSIPAAQLNNAVTQSNTGTEASLKASLQTLRAALPATAMITTYTYKPLVGVTTMISPNGQESSYVYDAAGRLDKILDQYGNTLKKMEYHYKN